MLPPRRSWIIGVTAGCLVGLVVSAAMTVMDWRLNPAGIFHDAAGTNWGVVAATAWSWFWPLALIVGSTALIIHAWVSRPR